MRAEALADTELATILDMTNIDRSVHRLSFAVKLNVLQPGYVTLQHGPRVKAFRGKNLYDAYVVSLHRDPTQITFIELPEKHWLSPRARNELLNHVRKYRYAYLGMWHDPTMSTDELRAVMDKIDAR